jgi:hypothetical protein
MFRSGRIGRDLMLLISSEIEVSWSMVGAMSPSLITSHELEVPHLDYRREGHRAWL